jgi:hypothetical protein
MKLQYVAEDGVSDFLRNDGVYIQIYTSAQINLD